MYQRRKTNRRPQTHSMQIPSTLASVGPDKPGFTLGRVSAIDTAKGVAIALVVCGHMVARDLKPQGNDWWMSFHSHLYSFHMAFFFFLSGYVFFMNAPDKWPSRLHKSVGKLLPAYFLFALIVYVAKFAAVRVLHVDRPVTHPLDELVLLVSYPTESFAQFLWFIVTLLMIYALVTLFRVWITRHLAAALAVAFGLHLLSVTNHVTTFLALQQVTRYALFFLLAGVCQRNLVAWALAVSRFGGLSVAAFAGSLILLPSVWLPTVAGLLSLPALFAVAAWLDRWPGIRGPLQFLGGNTLSIYLMSSLTMGLVRGIAVRMWGWDDWHFFVVAPTLIAAGLLLPIAIQRLVFARWAWTDRITR
jgi:fucose 4-O-acetylase-like acetyltransferase